MRTPILTKRHTATSSPTGTSTPTATSSPTTKNLRTDSHWQQYIHVYTHLYTAMGMSTTTTGNEYTHRFAPES